MLPLQRILCPTDFSDFSRGAIEKGAELARHFSAELCVLHVTQPVPAVHGISIVPGHAAFDAPAYEQAVQEGAEKELGEIIERHDLNDVRVRALVSRGSPAEEIVSAADAEKCDLIVIATHGLTGWRHHIFGSVAEKVLRLARCPVLVTRVAQPEVAQPEVAQPEAARPEVAQPEGE